MFEMFGQRSRPSSKVRRGPDIRYTLNVSLEEMYNGATKRLSLPRKAARGDKVRKTTKQIEIHIERGMQHGQDVYARGKGEPSPDLDVDQPGDVIFTLHQKEAADVEGAMPDEVEVDLFVVDRRCATANAGISVPVDSRMGFFLACFRARRLPY